MAHEKVNQLLAETVIKCIESILTLRLSESELSPLLPSTEPSRHLKRFGMTVPVLQKLRTDAASWCKEPDRPLSLELHVRLPDSTPGPGPSATLVEQWVFDFQGGTAPEEEVLKGDELLAALRSLHLACAAQLRSVFTAATCSSVARPQGNWFPSSYGQSAPASNSRAARRAPKPREPSGSSRDQERWSDPEGALGKGGGQGVEKEAEWEESACRVPLNYRLVASHPLRASPYAASFPDGADTRRMSVPGTRTGLGQLQVTALLRNDIPLGPGATPCDARAEAVRAGVRGSRNARLPLGPLTGLVKDDHFHLPAGVVPADVTEAGGEAEKEKQPAEGGERERQPVEDSEQEEQPAEGSEAAGKTSGEQDAPTSRRPPALPREHASSLTSVLTADEVSTPQSLASVPSRRESLTSRRGSLPGTETFRWSPHLGAMPTPAAAGGRRGSDAQSRRRLSSSIMASSPLLPPSLPHDRARSQSQAAYLGAEQSSDTAGAPPTSADAVPTSHEPATPHSPAWVLQPGRPTEPPPFCLPAPSPLSNPVTHPATAVPELGLAGPAIAAGTGHNAGAPPMPPSRLRHPRALPKSTSTSASEAAAGNPSRPSHKLSTPPSSTPAYKGAHAALAAANLKLDQHTTSPTALSGSSPSPSTPDSPAPVLVARISRTDSRQHRAAADAGVFGQLARASPPEPRGRESPTSDPPSPRGQSPTGDVPKFQVPSIQLPPHIRSMHSGDAGPLSRSLSLPPFAPRATQDCPLWLVAAFADNAAAARLE